MHAKVKGHTNVFVSHSGHPGGWRVYQGSEGCVEGWASLRREVGVDGKRGGRRCGRIYGGGASKQTSWSAVSRTRKNTWKIPLNSIVFEWFSAYPVTNPDTLFQWLSHGLQSLLLVTLLLGQQRHSAPSPVAATPTSRPLLRQLTGDAATCTTTNAGGFGPVSLPRCHYLSFLTPSDPECWMRPKNADVDHTGPPDAAERCGRKTDIGGSDKCQNAWLASGNGQHVHTNNT